MSAGSGHHRPNLKHRDELAKLMQEGGTAELAKRWQRFDVDHDMPYLAGYNVDGTVRFLDKDIFRAILEPDYAKQILGGPIETGLTPEQTIDCLLEHEAVEKELLDADNPVDTYEAAHEFATEAENEKVRSYGGAPVKYERGLAKAIAWCAKKELQALPVDLACAPMLDHADAADKRILDTMKRKGVEDAAKIAKLDVDYSKSSGADQCHVCVNWLGDRGADLSKCRKVDGLVRTDRWCTLFKGTAR